MLFPYFNSNSDPQHSQHDLYIEYITKMKVSDYTTSGCSSWISHAKELSSCESPLDASSEVVYAIMKG